MSPALSLAEDDMSILGAVFSPQRRTSAADAEKADGIPVDTTNERVLQTFMRELQQSPPFLQRLHLRMLNERLHPFLARIAASPKLVTAEDLEGLLLHLLMMTHRRGGLTPIQEQINDECSDAAFAMLFHMTTTLHHASYRVRDAWAQLLANVDLTLETIVLGTPAAARRVESAPEDTSVLEGLDATAVDQANALHREAETAFEEEEKQLQEAYRFVPALAADAPKFPHDAYWFTLDCLPPEVTCGLTEAEFQQVETWFAGLDLVGGKYAVTAGMNSKGGLLGVRVLNRRAIAEWTKLFPDGTATLADVLVFLFKRCSIHAIQQRIEGACVGHVLGLFPDDVEPDLPTSVTQLVRLPPAQEAAEQLIQSACGEIDVLRSMLHLKRIYDAADPFATGTVTEAAVKAVLGRYADANFGRYNLFAPFEAAERAKVARDAAGVAISFDAFVSGVMNMTSENNKAFARAQEDLARIRKWAAKDAAFGTRKRDSELDVAVLRYGPKAKRLTVPHRVALRDRQAQLIASVDRVNVILRRRAMRQHQLKVELSEVEGLRNRIHRSQMDFREKNVPLVLGPVERPPQFHHTCGIEYSAKLFDLSAFFEGPNDGRRADVIQLLKAFDALGIHPQLFLHNSNRCAAHYVKPVLSDFGRVFRDMIAAPRRPPTQAYWRGSHHVHVKTTIDARSDIKYMILVEGFNPGTNGPINVRLVGHASKGLGEVGDLEKFGWPAGWDDHVSTIHGVGCEKASQYVSSDGFVCVELVAKSFSQVGLSVSAFAVTPQFSGIIGCNVYHCYERL